MRCISCSKQVSSTTRHERRLHREGADVTRSGVVFTVQTWPEQLQRQPQQRQLKLIECVLTLTVSVLSATGSYLPAHIDVIGVEHTTSQW